MEAKDQRKGSTSGDLKWWEGSVDASDGDGWIRNLVTARHFDDDPTVASLFRLQKFDGRELKKLPSQSRGWTTNGK